MQTPYPLQPMRHARNGLIPSCVEETEATGSLNFAAHVRGKNAITWAVPIASIPTGVGSTRTRWRGAFHTSPTHRRLRVMLYMAHADTTGGGGGGSNPSATITATDATEGVTYGSNTFSYGTLLGSPVDTPDRFGGGEIILGGCPADSHVYLRIDDVNGGRLIAISVCEENLKLISGNGYVLPAGVSVSSPILDARRETRFELATQLWKRGAAQLWNWSRDLMSSPFTNATGTFTNVIDGTSTAVSAATPGATLDLRYCRTRGLSTVPVKFYVRAKMSAGSDTGEVSLMNSAGSPVLTLSINGSTESWYSGTVNLPATETKYDIHAANPDASETLSVYASSLAQYLA